MDSGTLRIQVNKLSIEKEKPPSVDGGFCHPIIEQKLDTDVLLISKSVPVGIPNVNIVL
jgi:hypothetical protein